MQDGSGNPFDDRGPGPGEDLDPCSVHVPIGIPDAPDDLKTFVEGTGAFSPGCGSFGVSFAVRESPSGALYLPGEPGTLCVRDLHPEGCPIPRVRLRTPGAELTIRICHVAGTGAESFRQTVGLEVTLAPTLNPLELFLILRPEGPAGGAVRSLTVGPGGDSLLVDGQPAVLAGRMPDEAGVLSTDTVRECLRERRMPCDSRARSATGDCSGAMRFAVAPSGTPSTLGFLCPVLPGRRVAPHRWDGCSEWAQTDTGPAGPDDGVPIPKTDLAELRALRPRDLFTRAEAYWQSLFGSFDIRVPDPRWRGAMKAIPAHIALAMNGGAPDVAVVNYNVFNRDGAYAANILQKAGALALAARACEYFLDHPFNGRVRCEADNPGQVLWTLGQHRLFGGNDKWLRAAYPRAAEIADLIRHCRTEPGPHRVKAGSRLFGDALPADAPSMPPAERTQILVPGSCDGHHPEYTEAFDIAGIRAAALLAREAGDPVRAREFDVLAGRLFDAYRARFEHRLGEEYGSYCVLWPCALYPLAAGPAHDTFRNIGGMPLHRWRYFAPATAHQGLLAGNREAGYGTVGTHLDHPQMAGWYAFDEGGPSGPGGWHRFRTGWDPSRAMPHGWAIAEVWLLMRDCLVFEDGDRLVLLGGVDPHWLADPAGIAVEGLPTHFGPLDMDCRPDGTRIVLTLGTRAEPPGGFVLRLPPGFTRAAAGVGDAATGDVSLPVGTSRVVLQAGGSVTPTGPSQ